MVLILSVWQAGAQPRLISEDSLQQVPRPDGTWTIDVSSDGRYLAMGGDDSLLRILHAVDGRLFQVYKMPSMVRCVVWHPKQHQVAVSTSGSQHFLIHLFTGSAIVLTGNQNGARGIDWNKDGTLVAAAGAQGEVVIWKSDGTRMRTILMENRKSYSSIHWHPLKNEVLVGGDELQVFDTAGNRKLLLKHRKEPIWILTVRWHPSGKFFALADYGHGAGGSEASLLQLRREDGTLIKTLRGSKAEYRNIRWSPNGRLLATASDALRLWSADGRLVRTDPYPLNLWGLAWRPDGRDIFTATFSPVELKRWKVRGKSEE